MSDETTSPSETTEVGSVMPTPEARTITIPTTDSLTQERLQAIADECLLPYREVEGGIEVDCADEETAYFWTERGRVWGTFYDEPPVEAEPGSEPTA